jgi:hypothetical protein
MTNLKVKQFNIDGAAEEEYMVEDDMISINDDYLSDTSESLSLNKNNNNNNNLAQQVSNKKNNFFQITAQHLMKLFSKKQSSKKTIITRTTTTTTTLKAAIQHDNDELSDIDDQNSTTKMNQRKKVIRYHSSHHHHHHHHHRPKHYQIYHRIPFHQKLNTKNFKLVQIKLDRSNLISNSNTNNTLSTSLFGFTIVGYCPCQIGKIESNSLASNAGLLTGDLIIKINGKNVSRATCDSIVKIIK